MRIHGIKFLEKKTLRLLGPLRLKTTLFQIKVTCMQIIVSFKSKLIQLVAFIIAVHGDILCKCLIGVPMKSF